MALLTSRELAAELHFTVAQICKWAKLGKIPAMKFASEWRFDLQAVRQAAVYTDPIAQDARQAARRAWMRPKRRAS